MQIYKITNSVNGKIYVGKDKDDVKNYFGSGILINKAIKKYGIEKFSKEIIENCYSINQMNLQEIYWIAKLESQNPEIGYNVSFGGDGGDTFSNNPNKEQIREKYKSRSHTEETKQKISLNNWQKINKGEKHPKFGTQWTEHQREMMIIFWETKGGPMQGKTHTDKAKLANKEKHLGKKASKETKDRMSLSHKGIPQQIITCPHCGKCGGTTMYRWHFDNCKKLKT